MSFSQSGPSLQTINVRKTALPPMSEGTSCGIATFPSGCNSTRFPVQHAALLKRAQFMVTSKAIPSNPGWTEMPGKRHVSLVSQYFRRSGEEELYGPVELPSAG